MQETAYRRQAREQRLRREAWMKRRELRAQAERKTRRMRVRQERQRERFADRLDHDYSMNG